MSSGTPEGPSPNPDDWRSPYRTGPGGVPGYGAQPHDRDPQGHGAPGDAYGRTGDPYGAPGDPYGRTGHGRDHGAPTYGSPGHDPGYGAPAYGPGHDPGYGASTYDLGHGAQGYGTPAYDPGYGTPGYGDPYGARPHRNVDGVRTHAIVALVVSITLAMSCFVSLGGLLGAILSGIALGKVETDTSYARKLLTWTWIGIGANIGLLVLGLVAVFATAAGA
ncbi:hypothetical protein [Planomonospora sp. ID82291]|uniref:hypothetical protein n=1 Tax=Planomonospora sp. ID82291 TaxID=2738136 RepID=UPI0018C444E9|nr:hypothetical protein [Planomonospora sp. ID82291]MBG0814754.1 hypothetical protein [Planomonospora sp. ID82291]